MKNLDKPNSQVLLGIGLGTILFAFIVMCCAIIALFTALIVVTSENSSIVVGNSENTENTENTENKNIELISDSEVLHLAETHLNEIDSSYEIVSYALETINNQQYAVDYTVLNTNNIQENIRIDVIYQNNTWIAVLPTETATDEPDEPTATPPNRIIGTWVNGDANFGSQQFTFQADNRFIGVASAFGIQGTVLGSYEFTGNHIILYYDEPYQPPEQETITILSYESNAMRVVGEPGREVTLIRVD